MRTQTVPFRQYRSYMKSCRRGELILNSSKSDFTQGSIIKKLISFMVPILGALILQAAYGAVDLLVVGRFGTTSGLSAVSTGSQVLNLVTFVITQFAMGITVLINRFAHWQFNHYFHHCFCCTICYHGMLCKTCFYSYAGA